MILTLTLHKVKVEVRYSHCIYVEISFYEYDGSFFNKKDDKITLTPTSNILRGYSFKIALNYAIIFTLFFSSTLIAMYVE